MAPEAVVFGVPAEPPLPVPPAELASVAAAETPESTAQMATAQPSQVPAVPDLPSIPPAIAPMAMPTASIAQNPEPVASLDDLNRCQNQMAALTTRFSSLEDTHQKSQHALALLLAEQRRLKLDNERLKRELELNHQQDIESLDSLSQIIEEVVSAPAAATLETPASAESGSNAAESTTATPLPAVETSL